MKDDNSKGRRAQSIINQLRQPKNMGALLLGEMFSRMAWHQLV
jgi:hypothetical protein